MLTIDDRISLLITLLRSGGWRVDDVFAGAFTASRDAFDLHFSVLCDTTGRDVAEWRLFEGEESHSHGTRRFWYGRDVIDAYHVVRDIAEVG